MSQKETWRTRKYWSKIGGLLIEEFIAVNGTKTIGRRSFDGLIILNEPSGIHNSNYYDIEGKDVVIIQTKRGRLGMNLLGQAFFSQFLVLKYKPKSIKSIAICGKYDDIIGKLAKEQGIEVVVIKDDEYEEQYDSPKFLSKNKAI